jgi:uncharacterized protein
LSSSVAPSHVIDPASARKAAIFLCVFAVVEGGFIVAYPHVWLGAAFAKAASASLLGWVLAALVTIGFIVYSVATLPLLRSLLPLATPFRLLSPLIAVPSGILEEVFFRTGLMNAFSHQSVVLQIAISGVAFGLVHAFWGIRGGFAAVRGAVGSTTVLGLALATVYVASGRVVLPCVVAHFAINLVLEPWLAYAYILRSRAAR